MNKKTKIILGVVLVISLLSTVILGVFFYLKYQQYTQEKMLKEEINRVATLDVTKDTFTLDIVTKGDYGKVEATIKKYMQTYASALQGILMVTKDERFSQMLSIENYQNDGPEFKTTKAYITETKENMEKNFATINSLATEENILKAIQNQNLEAKYVKIYNELMINENLKDDLKYAREEMEKTHQLMIDILEKSEKVIDFLIKNQGKWRVKDNVVEFDSDALVKEYNQFVDEIKSVMD